MPLLDAISEQARVRPDHPALEDGTRIVRYGALPRLIDATAWRLHDQGLRGGDTVGVMAGDGADHVVLLLALHRLGAVVVSIDGRQPLAERRRAVSKLALAAVVAAGRDEPAMHDHTVELAEVCDLDGPSDRGLDTPPPDGEAPFVCRQSSGTTGVPKSVIWSAHDLLRLRDRLQSLMAWRPDDRYYQLVRLCFSFSRDQVLEVLSLGVTVVIGHETTPESQMRAIRDKEITFVFATNAHLRGFLALPCDQPPLFPGLRVLVSTSGAITPEERIAATRRLSPSFYDGYGTNEVGGLVFAGPDDIAAAPESLGRVLDGIEATIVAADGHEAGPDEIGLACFRCEAFPAGYVNDPEASARHFRNGWYSPGDLMSRDRDGRLTFQGRADDVINNQGAKFYPMEVEQVLLQHPEIDEVAVFGWRSNKAGQVAAACIVARRQIPLTELRAYCMGRLAGHKVPAVVSYRKSLPKTASGKVRMAAVKDLMRPILEKRLS